MSNEELREMAKLALENWVFDKDPHGNIKRGLEYLAMSGIWEQVVINAQFAKGDKWDNLRNWANFLGDKNNEDANQ